MYFNQRELEKLNDPSIKMYFNPQGMEKLNDTSTKMYFNQQGSEKLNDTPTNMYFDQHGFEMLYINQDVFQPAGFGEVIRKPRCVSTKGIWRS